MNNKLNKMTQALEAKTKVSSGKLVPMEIDDINLTNDAEEDYNIARKNLKELLNKSDEALDHMMQVAAEAEHTRAFEVLSGMIKNISDVNDRLMDLNKKKKDIDKKDDIKQIANTTNNLFVGSTTELQKLLKKEADIVNVTPKSE